MDASTSGMQQVEVTADLKVPQVERIPGGAVWRVVKSHPSLQGLLAFVIYLVILVTLYGRPLIRHLNVPDLRQYWTDPNFYIWTMQWWPYAVTHGTNPLYSAQLGAPTGYNLAWVTTTPSVGLLMWPVTALFGVLVSYNIAILLMPPLAAWATFLAARRLTSRFWPSLLAGTVYGFSSFELMHSWQGETNLTAIAVFPLMVYLVLLWWQGALKNTWFAIWLGLAMAVQFYTFTEDFFDMTMVLAGGLLIGWAVAGRAAWRKVGRLATLTAIAYAGAIVVAAPYLYYALKNVPTTLTRQKSEFSLSMIRLILPWTDKDLGQPSLTRFSAHIGRVDIDTYVGLPVILILLGLAVFTWRSKITRLLVFMFVFVIALGAGPELVLKSRPLFPLPWGYLWSLPIARAAEPSRLIVFGALVLALAMAVLLSQPVKGKLLLAGCWGLALLAVVTSMLVAPTAHQAVNPIPYGTKAPRSYKPVNQLPPFITDGMYRRYLSPGETVVIVTRRGNAGMLFQSAADFYFRIAGGFINASLTPQNALPHEVSNLTHPSKATDKKFEDWVRSAKIGAIVVEQAWEQKWMQNFETKLGMHGTSVGGVTIYPTAPWLASLAHAKGVTPSAAGQAASS